jgi:hypothetical protein
LTLDEAVSKRFIISTLNKSMTLKEYAIILDEEFKSKGYNVIKTLNFLTFTPAIINPNPAYFS